jgi:hypothetical protein
VGGAGRRTCLRLRCRAARAAAPPAGGSAAACRPPPRRRPWPPAAAAAAAVAAASCEGLWPADAALPGEAATWDREELRRGVADRPLSFRCSVLGRCCCCCCCLGGAAAWGCCRAAGCLGALGPVGCGASGWSPSSCGL